MSPRLCIKGCGRIATIPKARATKSFCQPCWQAMPCNQRAQRGSLNPTRRAQFRQNQRRRLRLGTRYVGYAKTPDEARAINAHIRSRIAEFKSNQRAGASGRGADV